MMDISDDKMPLNLVSVSDVTVSGIRLENATVVFAKFCSEILGCSISPSDFSIVHELDPRRTGVLLTVSSLSRKQQILTKAEALHCQVLFVGIC